jgi:hypothetical protein
MIFQGYKHMAAKWSGDSEAVLGIIGRAYGAPRPTHQDIAARKPTVVTFDPAELGSMQAKIADLKQALASS